MLRKGGAEPRVIKAPPAAGATPVPLAGENATAVVVGSAVWLFWSSRQRGRSVLWTLTSTFTSDVTASSPAQLTDHPAGDEWPSAVVQRVGSTNTIWLFWQSSRRGPTDLWAMTSADGTRWSAPCRITSGQPRDQMPHAFIDDTGALRLTWSADLGDRSRIFQSTLSGAPPKVSVGPPGEVSSAVTDSSTFRDVAPVATQIVNDVWVFWSSNRDGLYRLWASRHTGGGVTGWSAPITVTTGRHAETEPVAFVDAAKALRLLFRTQQSGEAFRSHTVDLDDAKALQPHPGALDDRWHYTYSVDNTDPASRWASTSSRAPAEPSMSTA